MVISLLKWRREEPAILPKAERRGKASFPAEVTLEQGSKVVHAGERDSPRKGVPDPD